VPDGETFLRGLAERELRHWIRGDRDGPPFTPVSQLGRAVATLTQADVIEDNSSVPLLWELNIALAVRSGAQTPLIARAARFRGSSGLTAAPPTATSLPAEPLAIPVGCKIQVSSERAPCDLHLMTYVRTEHNAAISTAIRMRWPADGSSTDLEIQGAGPHHLPYRELVLTDANNTRYRMSFRGDGGTADWHGILLIDPPPPEKTRWLDLVADGSHRLARLDLTRSPASASVSSEQVAALPWERMLGAGAEQILADAAVPGMPEVISYLASDIEVLTGAGAIAPDSPLPGQLAALCERLGISRHGIAAAPAVIPAPWASVIEHGTSGEYGISGEEAQDVVVPLAASLPRIDGVRFAVAGLTTMAGRSTLHVIASGPVASAGPWFYGRYFGCSWWVKDTAGDWHVGTAREPDFLADDAALALTLHPPLTSAHGARELVVTGASTRVHVTLDSAGSWGDDPPHPPMDN
jgi:hypothetical protein